PTDHQGGAAQRVALAHRRASGVDVHQACVAAGAGNRPGRSRPQGNHVVSGLIRRPHWRLPARRPLLHRSPFRLNPVPSTPNYSSRSVRGLWPALSPGGRGEVTAATRLWARGVAGTLTASDRRRPPTLSPACVPRPWKVNSRVTPPTTATCSASSP